MNKEKNKNIINAINWLETNEPANIKAGLHCSTRDIFVGRLNKLQVELSQKLNDPDVTSLITAIVGEIGNNSFDHNLGKWRDIPGIYFGYNLTQKIVVLADRGQGVKKTISQVKPKVKDDLEALKIAFTQIISGRAPELRGNGLKFVAKVVENNKFALHFQSGTGLVETDNLNFQLNFSQTNNDIKGTLTIIKF